MRLSTSIETYVACILCGVLLGTTGACSTTKKDYTEQASGGSDSGAGDAGTEFPEPPLEQQPFFSCDPDGMPNEMVVTEVEERPGDELVIRKTPAACQVDLLYRQAGAGDTVLSAVPEGYLLVEAVDRLVCASVIFNFPVVGEEPQHEITGVPIDCALRASNDSWLPMQRIVNPPGRDWAGWIQGIRKLDSETYAITYLRDFTLQFLTMSDTGRPAGDGMYEVTVSIAGDVISVTNVAKLSDQTMVTEVEDPTPGCPEGEYDPANPLCANAQHPGETQFDGDASATEQPFDYNMGYRFTPTADGVITALGGYYNGTKTVRLYEAASGALLASVAHTSSNEFGYTAVDPIPVTADTSYVIAVYLAGSGGVYDTGYSAGATHGDIRIDCPGVYGYGTTAMPTACAPTVSYGMADIEFRRGSGGFCGDAACDPMESCSSCAVDCGACSP